MNQLARIKSNSDPKGYVEYTRPQLIATFGTLPKGAGIPDDFDLRLSGERVFPSVVKIPKEGGVHAFFSKTDKVLKGPSIIDISKGGLKLSINNGQLIEKDTELNLNVKIEKKTYYVKGKVVRIITPNKFGIEFLDNDYNTSQFKRKINELITIATH